MQDAQCDVARQRGSVASAGSGQCSCQQSAGSRGLTAARQGLGMRGSCGVVREAGSLPGWWMAAGVRAANSRERLFNYHPLSIAGNLQRHGLELLLASDSGGGCLLAASLLGRRLLRRFLRPNARIPRRLPRSGPPGRLDQASFSQLLQANNDIGGRHRAASPHLAPRRSLSALDSCNLRPPDPSRRTRPPVFGSPTCLRDRVAPKLDPSANAAL